MDLLFSGNAEKLWNELFCIVSNHSSVRQLYTTSKMPYQRMTDIYTDLTQDLFLRLYEKDRLQFYLDADYTDEKVEQELYRFELPNLISEMMRAQTPESYRIARRTSILLKTRSDFQHYPKPAYSAETSSAVRQASYKCKLALRVYGLRSWPTDKPVRDHQQMRDRIKDVAFRMRDTRRTGRGNGSQIIISNAELNRLIREIFKAIDSPADVRTIRSMVLSKLMVEDTRFVSIDTEVNPSSTTETELPRVDLADERPTPEEILIGKEMSLHVEETVTEILKRMRQAVRNKPKRYGKLVHIVWYCYFSSPPLSQSSIAELMGISDSLVTHYRKIFDDTIRGLDINVEELLLLNDAIRDQLSSVIKEKEPEKVSSKPEHHTTGSLVAKYRECVASSYD
jgi:hypothetical protein